MHIHCTFISMMGSESTHHICSIEWNENNKMEFKDLKNEITSEENERKKKMESHLKI